MRLKNVASALNVIEKKHLLMQTSWTASALSKSLGNRAAGKEWSLKVVHGGRERHCSLFGSLKVALQFVGQEIMSQKCILQNTAF